MARMIPSRPVETESRAEVKAFHAFEEALGEGWVVAHSVRWLYKSKRGRMRPPEEREVDFFLAHPEFGALVLEIKGGEIRFDSATGKWVSRGRDGVFEIKDPIKQAQSAMHSLVRSLEEHPGIESVGPVGFAVGFPDGVTSSTPLPSAPPQVVFQANDFLDSAGLGTKVEVATKFWRGERRGKWTRSSLNAAVDFISHDYDIRTPSSLALDEADRELIRLSESQFRVLDQLGRNARVAIAGCAGSGKTLLAAELADRLAAADFRTLLVCYNRPLADHVRTRVRQNPKLDVATFHQVCSRRTNEARIRIPEPSEQSAEERVALVLTGGLTAEESYWRVDMPEALARAAEKIGPRYDAIVADEGQDFEETWWLALLTLLEDPDRGTFFVFYDDNQVLYIRPMGLPDGMFDFQLTENWRNTREIHRYVDHYYQGAPVTPLGPDGPQVRVTNVEWKQLRETAGQILNRLIVEEGVAPREITVLTRGSAEHSPLNGKLGEYLLTETPTGPRHIRLSSVRRFKGLDSKVVILAGVKADADEDRELIYVGASRARTHLEVIGLKKAKKS